MTVVLSTAARNASANAIAALVDAGPAAGKIVLRTAGDVAVSTLVMSDPAFGVASVGVVTANAITTDPAAVGGTTTKFTLEDSTGTVVLSGSVGTSGSDINLTNTVIAPGVPVSLSSFTVTAPAS